MGEQPIILLVDDREENLFALEALLQGQGADLLKARSGDQALELLLVHDVGLALVDVQMPEMDGFELAELMRGTERTRDIPLIFITAGEHDRGRIFKGYQSGAVDFLHKPLDPQVLRSKVGVFLQLDRQKRQLAQRVMELKEAEERLKEADRRKDEFLAVLSHELRNPLMPIRNSVHILQKTPAGSDAAQRAQAIIERQVSHLARLVDDLLDVTRITRGKIQLQRQPVDLRDVVRRTVEDHRSIFAERGVALEVRVPTVVMTVHADATRMAQIVGNLLGNAVKFTPRGGTVQLALEQQDTDAVLSVRDTGVGIASEILARIFEPFAQAERTLARSQGGLGLGLALVKALVEMHDGSVRASSEGQGRGAEFTVRLPLQASALTGLPASPSSPPVRNHRRRVLIVEDEPDGAASLAEAVRLMGHEVAVAHDGRTAVTLGRSFRPDFVLCDIGLPVMDGYEVARQFGKDQHLSSATLIAITGYALPDDQRRAREAGFAHHLAKPPRFDTLADLLSRVPDPRNCH